MAAVTTARTATGTIETSRARAAALPPEERRARIVEATLPLLLAHGAAVTTRQIAEAAGIAEGTIFRVFPDKETLIAAVVEAALDTSAVDAALDAIDAALPLEARLVAAVDDPAPAHGRRAPTPRRGRHPRPATARPTSARSPACSRPTGTSSGGDPSEAAQVLRGLTLAGTHPALAPEEPLTSEEIVSLLLDGVRRRDGEDAR